MDGMMATGLLGNVGAMQPAMQPSAQDMLVGLSGQDRAMLMQNLRGKMRGGMPQVSNPLPPAAMPPQMPIYQRPVPDMIMPPQMPIYSRPGQPIGRPMPMPKDGGRVNILPFPFPNAGMPQGGQKPGMQFMGGNPRVLPRGM